MNNTIHIAYCFQDSDGKYSRYVATSIVSVCLHTNRNIIFHILHDCTLTEENRVKLEETVTLYNQKIIFHKLVLDEDIKSIETGAITVGTLYRLCIPSVCKGCSKIIYLDADILVQCDIGNLYDVELGDFGLAAVRDVVKTREDYINNNFYRKLGVHFNKYFNAGVLVFNCEKIGSSKSLLNIGLNILVENSNLSFLDQDVLNIVFSQDVILVDSCYNNMLDTTKKIDDIELQSKTILHFAGYFKPWNTTDSSVIRHYYAYMARTAYVNNLTDLIDIMSIISISYDKKMDFKHCLLIKEYRKKTVVTSVLLLLRLLAPYRYFNKLSGWLWEMRYKFKLFIS